MTQEKTISFKTIQNLIPFKETGSDMSFYDHVDMTSYIASKRDHTIESLLDYPESVRELASHIDETFDETVKMVCACYDRLANSKRFQILYSKTASVIEVVMAYEMMDDRDTLSYAYAMEKYLTILRLFDFSLKTAVTRILYNAYLCRNSAGTE